MHAAIRQILQGYIKLEPHIRNLIALKFCLDICNTSFFVLLNYYMSAEGYIDYEIARVLSYRFLAVFVLAFPLGLYIKGRRLVPFYWVAAICLPALSLAVIWAVAMHQLWLVYGVAMVWGLAYTCIQVTVLPFILLNAKQETHSEAITLRFFTFGSSTFLVGVMYATFNSWDPTYFNEKTMLTVFSCFGFLGIYFLSKIKVVENRSKPVPIKKIKEDYDWAVIGKVTAATFLIALGAGFTIPVINLFFLNIHGISAKIFSLTGSGTFFLVMIVMLSMPYVRRRFGYRFSIVGFQSMAILALFLMATTEYYKQWVWAAPLALLFYMLRQPLMNAATPIVSELSMYYVGNRNQELMSSINASIWSGTWFISTWIFSLLRQAEFRYVSIFMITVLLYVCGTTWYWHLIKSYEENKNVPQA